MKKKDWERRIQPDQSQRLRLIVQTVFLALNLWIGAQFYFFVRYFEQGGARFDRPPGVEGWLPIAGMMNTFFYLRTGTMPEIHPAAMVLFLTFLALSLAFRKSFCGWLCPIGTISERLWKIGRQTFRRVFFPPKWIDIPLRGLKYILFGLFLWAVGGMSAAGIEAFLASPYGLVADVKMLDFFRRMSPFAATVVGLLVIGSFFVPNFWCRYLCPYGALMGLASLASPLRIRRVPDLCIDCNKCAKACPANLPVDKLIQVRSAECIGCMECVAECPAEGALYLARPKAHPVHVRALAAAMLALFAVAVTTAKVTGHWHSPIPDHVYEQLIPMAADFQHP
ncbi:MAG: 4Fe-4S binding protein [Acidimicrobiia bacterium]|nr:4Fe-4S binding protein [Acidimicrobiia bacterium]